MTKSLQIYLICIVYIVSFHAVSAQSDSTKHPPKFTVKGYVKYLEEVSFAGDASQLLTNDLIHNRLNFRYEPDANLNFRLEVRNRLYYGELIQDYPSYASFLTAPNGTFDMSKNWVNHNAVLFNSAIDRASAEYHDKRWDITIGRQRINWGISTVWTPNDIFNTFNYFDFDYEERPGTDAATIQYAFNSSSSLEIAASPGKTSDKNIEALMYRFNKWHYDFQLFSGIYQQNYTVGAGWAGNIKDAGFKGEVTYFASDKNLSDSNSIAGSLSFDYGFKDGIYFLVSGLYNSSGNDSIPNIAELTTEPLSAKNIFPFKYTLFAELSYPFTPIFKGSLGGMYSLSGNSIIILPSLTYSIADNWVLDFIGQAFFAQNNGSYHSLGNAVYLRLKWGF